MDCQALFPTARLLVSAHTVEFQSPRIFPLFVRRNHSVLFALKTISCALVLPMKSFTPILFPESDQLGATSELVEVQVARPLASETRTLFSHGEPHPIVT